MKNLISFLRLIKGEIDLNGHSLTAGDGASIREALDRTPPGLPIDSKQLLENKRLEIAEHNQQEQSLPISKDYCGISVKPLRFVFYAYRLDELSDVWEYQIEGSEFVRRLLSP